jgi:hypothetical protein
MITVYALEKLGFTPEVDFSLQDDGQGVYIKQWMSASPQPTEAEIEAAHAEWEAEHAATQYQRDRAAEYPSIEALVVALWEGVVEERMAAVTALEAIRQQVKARYPKP